MVRLDRCRLIAQVAALVSATPQTLRLVVAFHS
jgi:hypothetical protein